MLRMNQQKMMMTAIGTSMANELPTLGGNAIGKADGEVLLDEDRIHLHRKKARDHSDEQTVGTEVRGGDSGIFRTGEGDEEECQKTQESSLRGIDFQNVAVALRNRIRRPKTDEPKRHTVDVGELRGIRRQERKQRGSIGVSKATRSSHQRQDKENRSDKDGCRSGNHACLQSANPRNLRVLRDDISPVHDLLDQSGALLFFRH